MPHSRRSFLKQSSAFALGLSLGGCAGGSGGLPALEEGRPGSGLLFGPGDVERIRRNLESPRFAAVAKAMRIADGAGGASIAESIAEEIDFLEHELRLTNHVHHMPRARVALEHGALAYALYGRPEQLKLCKVALRRLCAYKRWDYFLEGGEHTIGLQRAPEATIAVILALDWLGDALSPAERELAERNVAEKGAPACFRTLYGLKHPDRVRGWTLDRDDDYRIRFDLSRWPIILNSTNLKVVPIAGLGLAACYFSGKRAQAGKWLSMARSSARSFAQMFHPDGSYDEGVGYWGYSASHLALFAEVLWRTLGVDDRSLINYQGTVRFALCMSMPTLGEPFLPGKPGVTSRVRLYNPADDMVNLGDSGLSLDVTVAPWAARVHRDPLSQYVAENIGGINLPWGAIWYRPGLPSAPPGDELLDVKLDNDWVISRSGWQARDSVVALRSGGPANHEHADRNSVIFKSHGERLFHDPLRASYSPKSARWRLRQTHAHTAVLIDGKGHQYHDGREGTNSSWAWSKVTAYVATRDWMTVTSDATEAYALVEKDVALVERTLVYLKPDLLILVDRVAMKTREADARFRYQVFNADGNGAATAGKASFRIERPHAHLKAAAVGAGPLAIQAGFLDLPEDEGIFPFVEVASSPALAHVVVTACCASPAAEVPSALQVKQVAAGSWAVTGRHRGRTIDVAIEVGIEVEPGKPPRVQISKLKSWR